MSNFLACACLVTCCFGLVSVGVAMNTSLPTPPIIENGSTNQTLSVKNLALLPCRVRDDGTKISVKWYKDKEPLEMGRVRHVIQNKDGALQINNLEHTDTGWYTCEAVNEHGKTHWSSYLQVGELTDNSLSFKRMHGPDYYPSAPGRPAPRAVSDYAVELQWSTPSNHGKAPIQGYRVEYYSPKLGSAWRSLVKDVRYNRATVDNLSPGARYEFIVRAQNEYGLGPPSNKSQVILTRASGQGSLPGHPPSYHSALNNTRVKLFEARPINATAVRLAWHLISAPDRSHVIKGYVIDRFHSQRGSEQYSRQQVNGRDKRTIVVTGLKPFTEYGFFVSPFSKDAVGQPSNTMSAWTEEGPPEGPPRNVVVRMMNTTTLRVSWRPPDPKALNGHLRGYQIVIQGNETRFNKNITTEENASSVILFKLIPSMVYHVRVAAYTNGGVGPYHGLDTVAMTMATLKVHLTLNEMELGQDKVGKFFKEPWFIAVLGVLVWVVLFVIVVYLIWRRRVGAKKGSPFMPFVKINDGMNPRDTLWMDSYPPAALRENGSLHNGTTINGNILLNDLTVNTSPNALGPPSYYEAQKYAPYRDVGAYGGGLDRSSESAYMQMSQQNLSTFHHWHGGAGPPRGESPTPYATTTLAMAGRAPMTQIYNEPAGVYDLRSQSSSTSQLQKAGLHHHLARHPPGSGFRPCEPTDRGHGASKRSKGKVDPSPPHTECSFIPSSDGNSGSSAGGSKDFCHNQISPCPPQLLDFIPPPPDQPPPSDLGTPPELSPELLRHISSTLDRRRGPDPGGHWYNGQQRAPGIPGGGTLRGTRRMDPSSAPMERRLRHAHLAQMPVGAGHPESSHLNELLQHYRPQPGPSSSGQGPARSRANYGSESGSHAYDADWARDCMRMSSPVTDEGGSPRSSYAEIPESRRSSMLASLATESPGRESPHTSLEEGGSEEEAFLPSPADIQAALARAAEGSKRPGPIGSSANRRRMRYDGQERLHGEQLTPTRNPALGGVASLTQSSYEYQPRQNSNRSLPRVAHNRTLHNGKILPNDTLNHCLDEIETFTNNLHSVYDELKRYKAEKANMKKSKQEKAVQKFMSAIPPGERFVDIFKKIKLALNLAANLENHMTSPKASDLCALMHQALKLVLDVCRMAHGDIAPRVVSPLFTAGGLIGGPTCRTT